MSPINKIKLNKLRKSLDNLDDSFIKLIKKDKKSIFSSISFNFLNKSFFSFILKFFGFIQILVLIFFLYMAVALEKDQIRNLINVVVQQTYWLGKMITQLPIKWSKNIVSDYPTLNLEISPTNYQLLMTMRNDAINRLEELKTDHGIRKGVPLLRADKQRVPAVLNYNGNKLDVRVRLKGMGISTHLRDTKFSLRVTLNDENFLGMKAFSLQHPKRRSYMSSFVMHKFSENENLTTKRFGLIPVSINGKYMGIYNYEEVANQNMTKSVTGVNNIVITLACKYVRQKPLHCMIGAGFGTFSLGTPSFVDQE